MKEEIYSEIAKNYSVLPFGCSLDAMSLAI